MRLEEIQRTIPYYRPVPLTRLPLIYHREHLFPYTSYGDTEATPVSREFRLVVLENDSLRIEVAPELGGRVYSLFDRRIGKEILFSNPVVKPVRILPIWAFISGGIEFNFPIAHSPTSVARVGYRTGRVGDYGFIRVGEREARTGMEWVVELGLFENVPVLIQRTALRNPTRQAHPWMSWTICAVRSTEGTEFVHPPHRVLVHDDRLRESEWPAEGRQWDANLRQMTALFWKPGSARRFGVFHHDLGFGLMHVADPRDLPGKKVWSYGHGRHREWGVATTVGDQSYAEIESGPLLDQGEKAMFPPGTERRFEESWVPVHARDAFDRREEPRVPPVPPWPDPWLGWAHSEWQTEWEGFRAGVKGLPASPVPTGLDLESALRSETERPGGPGREALALWLAFHRRPAEALAVLEQEASPGARRLAGLIRWRGLHDAPGAVADLRAGPLDDPMAVVELDTLYAALGRTADREALLWRAPRHRRIVERQADLALEQGRPAEALRLLRETDWPREHQRYVRTELWRRATAALGDRSAEVPEFLQEDALARFGAYWSDA